MREKKLVILNQAANYLTVGFANAFASEFDEVVLVTGGVHEQGERLSPKVKVHYIIGWRDENVKQKLKSYVIALWQMWWILMRSYRKHEVLFVSVPPMGYLLNLLLPHKFSMIIWDVYPDLLKVTGMKETHPVYRFWAFLNKTSFSKASNIFTIGAQMAQLLGKYVDASKVKVQPIWSIFQSNTKVSKRDNPFIKMHGLEGKFIVQYSGNIGLTHNVELLIDIAKELSNDTQILFQIIGRGPRKDTLRKKVETENLSNCMFLPFQDDQMFPFSLSAADLGVVILDESTSKGSVPSKTYNLMAFGVPALYLSSEDSELHTYAQRHGNALCFSKGQIVEAAQAISLLSKHPERLQKMSENAIRASSEFRRINADKFVQLYE